MRILLDETSGGAADDLATLYAPPESSWMRVNFVSTLDGAATGADGRSGSINNAIDKQVFDLLRTLSDVVVVGAGTLRTEGYGPLHKPLVIVSRRADVPDRLRNAEAGRVLLATWAGAEGREEAVDVLGKDNVLLLGDDDVDLQQLRPRLAERGLHQVLCEGGPHLFHDLVDARVVDELDLTWVPAMVAGSAPRILAGAAVETELEPHLLLESEGTLLGRWFVKPR